MLVAFSEAGYEYGRSRVSNKTVKKSEDRVLERVFCDGTVYASVVADGHGGPAAADCIFRAAMDLVGGIVEVCCLFFLSFFFPSGHLFSPSFPPSALSSPQHGFWERTRSSLR